MPAQAELFAYEGFDYDSGVPLEDAAGGEGWKGKWSKGVYKNGISPDAPQFTVEAESLTPPPGYEAEVTGGHIKSSEKYQDAVRELDAESLIDLGDNQTRYLSFLTKTTSLGKFSHAAVLLFDETGGSEDYHVLSVGIGRNQPGLWLVEGSGEPKDSEGKVEANKPILIVLKISAKSTGQDQVEAAFWDEDAELEGEPTSWPVKLELSSKATINRMMFKAGASASSFDEIRLGQSWNDVVE